MCGVCSKQVESVPLCVSFPKFHFVEMLRQLKAGGAQMPEK